MYRKINSMTTLKKESKLKTLASRDKGSGSNNLEPKIQEEEASKKVKEETARRLAEGTRNLLDEENQ